MNIFFLHQSVSTCARHHVDKHCVKMILEYAQLLSTAHRVLDGVEREALSKSGRRQKLWSLDDPRLDSTLYKATHANHPSAIWCRQSTQNYIFLAALLRCLCKEYTHRYGKIHRVEQLGMPKLFLTNIPKALKPVGFTEPTPAMPDKYKVEGDSVASYRNYYHGDKAHMFVWKNREQPDWIQNGTKI